MGGCAKACCVLFTCMYAEFHSFFGSDRVHVAAAQARMWLVKFRKQIGERDEAA